MSSKDLIHSILRVPLTERRSPLTMGLLWITMVTGFQTLLIGFVWYKNGFSLSQLLLCTTLSCLVLLAYSIPAAQLGARTGLGFTVLSRVIFGRFGSQLVTVNLIWMFVLFYGLGALILANSMNALFHMNYSLAWMAFGLALVMSLNNYLSHWAPVRFDTEKQALS